MLRTIKKVHILIALGFVIIGLAAANLPHLKYVSNFDDFHFLSDDVYEAQLAFEAQFSSSSSQDILILTHDEGWFTTKAIDKLTLISDSLTSYPSIGNVSSLTNFLMPKRKLLRTVSKRFFSQEATQSQIEVVKGDYKDVWTKFISRDGKYALIYLQAKPNQKIDYKKIKAFVDEQLGTTNMHIYNQSLLMSELASFSARNISATSILTFLLLLGCFYFFSRSFKPILLMAFMLVLNFSVLILFIQILDIKISPHLSTLPALVAILTFSDVLHIMYFKHQQLAENVSQKANVLVLPLTLTSLTNALGFIFYLLFSENPFMKELSTLALLTILVALIFSFALLSLDFRPFHVPKRIDDQVKATINMIVKRSKPLRVAIILVIGAIGGMFLAKEFIHVDKENNLSNKNGSIGKSVNTLNQQFFGNNQVQISLRTTNKQVYTNGIVMHEIHLIESKLNQELEPLYITSPNTVISRYNRYQSGKSDGTFRIPNKFTRYHLEQFNSVKSEAGWYEVVDTSATVGRIILGHNKGDLTSRIASYETLIKAWSDSILDVKMRGISYFQDLQEYEFLRIVLIGFLFTIVISAFLVGCITRSVLKGFYFLIANGFPIVIALNLMWIFGIKLNSVSIFMLTVMVGLCLDDSIYLVLRSPRKQRLTHVYYPIVVTTVVLAFGVLGFWVSTYDWVRNFSFILFFCFLLSLLLDIVLFRTNTNQSA